MRILITGSKGQLGFELQGSAPDSFEVEAYDVEDLDITQSEEVLHFVLDRRPDLIINTAAYTAVDKAETETQLAFLINAQGPQFLAAAAAQSGSRLFHISTDFVFDGEQGSPYRPEDTPNPLGSYGRSKLEGERLLMAALPDRAVIFRTSWLYSVHGKNFVKTMLNLMAERDRIGVVTDQIGTPTWARGLAETIWESAKTPSLTGIHHWTDSGAASWYDFAVAIYEEATALGLLNRSVQIDPLLTTQFPTPARRPPFSVMDKTSLCQAFGRYPSHWRVALRQMLTEYKMTQRV